MQSGLMLSVVQTMVLNLSEELRNKIMIWKEEIIQNIKDCGQSLIDNAENIVGDYKYARGFTITCYVDEHDRAPYIDVDVSFYPESFINNLKT
jgi:hypothetical protein